jgi:acyl-CoA thioester hydrolase
MRNRFKVLIRVRYCECDAQNVVFNARYGDYVDIAATEFFREIFGGWQELLDQGIDSQVVRLNTEWKSPARFDDVLCVSVETVKIGNSSYTLKLEFTEFYSHRPVAVSEITYVMVSHLKHEKLQIPADFRQKLAAGAMGKTVNLSGIAIPFVGDKPEPRLRAHARRERG